MDHETLLAALSGTCDAVASTLGDLEDWSLAGTRDGQYRSDLAADAVAVEHLLSAGLGVLSEESGRRGPPDAALVAVIDPVDGSTNASRGIPWYATSICVLDREGPLAAHVVNQATGRRYEAVRGKGATRDGRPIGPSGTTSLRRAVVGLSGYPPEHLGWRQYRALGAAALDLCAVADGTLDGYVDCGPDGHGVWDYLAGVLVCGEAGAAVAEASGGDLVVLDHAARREPVAAATPELLGSLMTARREAFGPPGHSAGLPGAR